MPPPLRLRAQELGPRRSLPARRRTKTGAPDDRPDRGRAHPDPELAQFALDPYAAPARVLPPQSNYQLPQLMVERRPTRDAAAETSTSCAPAPAANAKASAAKPRTPASAPAAVARSPPPTLPDPAVRVPDASPSSAARPVGAEAPRSPPPAQRQPSALQPAAQAAAASNARGRRTPTRS